MALVLQVSQEVFRNKKINTYIHTWESPFHLYVGRWVVRVGGRAPVFQLGLLGLVLGSGLRAAGLY